MKIDAKDTVSVRREDHSGRVQVVIEYDADRWEHILHEWENTPRERPTPAAVETFLEWLHVNTDFRDASTDD